MTVTYGRESTAGPRRARRILRKFDPWTVTKASAVVSALTGLGLVLLSVMLWAVISRLGLLTAIDDAAIRVALIDTDDSLFNSGGEYLFGVILLALGWTAASTALLTATAVLYNLISDLVGGVEFTVLEDSLGRSAAPGSEGLRQPTPGEG